jgi:hypothetical protein
MVNPQAAPHAERRKIAEASSPSIHEMNTSLRMSTDILPPREHTDRLRESRQRVEPGA